MDQMSNLAIKIPNLIPTFPTVSRAYLDFMSNQVRINR